MSELAYFKGVPIDGDIGRFLKEKGLSEDRIENMRNQAYSIYCCPNLEELNCASPVIDYGTPEVIAFNIYLPFMGKECKTEYKQKLIRFCPFCGTHLVRRIHPDSQRTLGDYIVQEKREDR